MQRGYTLIELLVVLALLGVLATAMLPLTEAAAQRAREAELKQALWQIREAIDAYKAAHDAGRLQAPQVGSTVGYPPSLQALVDGVASSNTPGGRVYFLRRLPRDPFADPALPAAATWGLRSYQSPPDKPAPGEDVYDVYSRSERVGLNGVPLRTW